MWTDAWIQDRQTDRQGDHVNNQATGFSGSRFDADSEQK
jgi:hypothetical protein